MLGTTAAAEPRSKPSFAKQSSSTPVQHHTNCTIANHTTASKLSCHMLLFT